MPTNRNKAAHSKYMVSYHRDRVARDPEYKKRKQEIRNKYRAKLRAAGDLKQKSRISQGYREAIVAHLLARDGNVCGICKQELGGKVHVNHIIAHALGGPNTLENFNLTHDYCNIKDGIKVRQTLHGK